MPDVINYDLLAAEHPRAVLQVDMVGCEHTETCLAVKYANSQVQHTIGQKQTEKCQTAEAAHAGQEKGGGQSWVPRKLGQLNTHAHAERQTHTHTCCL